MTRGRTFTLACILAALAVTLVLASCISPVSTTREPVENACSPASVPAQTSPTAAQDEILASIPAEARISSGGGGPRPTAYWTLWNTCAAQNRAAEAAANGGRAASWILVDDLLADPGIQLGDHPVATCAEALALLQGRTAVGGNTGDPAYGLDAQLLAAELNLNAGAETCPIA